MKFATKAIHIGQEPDPATGAIIPPIYQTSTYVQDELGVDKGHVYARVSNPTRSGLESCLASLEGAEFGVAFASGVAATHAALSLLASGDHVVVSDNVYGGTYRLFEQVLRNYGYDFSYADTRNLDAVQKSFKPNTKMLWIESPTNPLLHLADIAALCQLAKESSASHRILSVVDNTFATPALQQPISLGADIVVHSTSKYLGGHSDIVGGAVVVNDSLIHDALKFTQKAVGAIPGPMDCYLVSRGIKTLALRMRAHTENAFKIATHFEKHPALENVIYPGLPSHPQYELAKKQMLGAGGVVSIVVKGGLESAKILLRETHLFSLAEGLGGVESLIGYPATMSHGAMSRPEREARGIVEGLVRLSVGIEDIDDLIEDLEQALDQLRLTKQVNV